MASSYVSSEESKDHTPKGTMKRTWSNDSLSGQSGAPRACVCAPTTHAGSFRCRLHRVNSHGHQHQSHHHHQSNAPLPPQPAVSASTTRTVEAQ
ncbi:hypothetical protein AMTRI_Chr06g191230 [Amborella trichopoda]|uniref:Uncharacterized protein n=1 Tax=Amborella trichopoda TaxID=13333 RepID=W1PFA0_AMBTC|nr:hypothetical protein AMTR_s00016p00253230 [Amborella trichopoda]